MKVKIKIAVLTWYAFLKKDKPAWRSDLKVLK